MSYEMTTYENGEVVREAVETAPVTGARGPKPKRPELLRTHLATALLTKAESDEMTRIAGELGISISEFLRRGVNMYIEANTPEKSQ